MVEMIRRIDLGETSLCFQLLTPTFQLVHIIDVESILINIVFDITPLKIHRGRCYGIFVKHVKSHREWIAI
jgi:hypothetical protein